MTDRYSFKSETTEWWLPLCRSCGDVVGSRIEEYRQHIKNGLNHEEAMEKMRIYNHCTRAIFLTPNYRYYTYSKLLPKKQKAKIVTAFEGNYDFTVDKTLSEVAPPLKNFPTDWSQPTRNVDPNFTSPNTNEKSLGLTYYGYINRNIL